MVKKRLSGRDAARRIVLNWSGDPIGDLERISESYQEVARCRVQFLKSLDSWSAFQAGKGLLATALQRLQGVFRPPEGQAPPFRARIASSKQGTEFQS